MDLSPSHLYPAGWVPGSLCPHHQEASNSQSTGNHKITRITPRNSFILLPSCGLACGLTLLKPKAIPFSLVGVTGVHLWEEVSASYPISDKLVQPSADTH